MSNDPRTVTIIKGAQIGSGSFSIVYKATEQDTGRVVALKKGRVSLRVNRTLFQHEAAVLQTLRGHPTIPDVFAYGRVEHFELLSIQYFDRCLDDLMSETSPLSVTYVLRIANQLLSSLEHLHAHNVVHRDVKPSNVMVKACGSWDIVLIDFGLAYRPSQVREPPTEKQLGAFGTLPYASLYAHERSDLSYGDDLESLAYTLIYLLKGNLPWSYFSKHGTTRGCIRQVWEQKKRYDGQRLSTEIPVFGMLLDYARSLPRDVSPDYAALQKMFKQCTPNGGSIRPWKAQIALNDIYPWDSPAPPAPIEQGQIVLIQLLSAVSLEGYAESSDGDLSFIHDPSLKTSEWQSLAIPAVVTRVSWENGVYRFTAVAIAQWKEGCHPATMPSVPIVGPHSQYNDSQSTQISTQPAWPWDNMFCYAFKHPARFCCLPSQPKTQSKWRVSEVDVNLLKKHLSPRTGPATLELYDAVKHPDIDIQNAALLLHSAARLYASISPLNSDGPRVSNDSSVNWYSYRAWHDECVKVARRFAYDNGYYWDFLIHGVPRDDNELDDSYHARDHSLWCYLRQQERDDTLTISPPGTGPSVLASLLDSLDRINLLEN
ncbi:hypothetical protein QCA50_000953 [Cerrena zonata]|uniref:non-specific serine/threonine protein kinase n=1 Tax=Cerrena zonata TaxID=2478898 RepID=A0AAW0GVW6_9APHY